MGLAHGVVEDYGGPATYGQRVGQYDWAIAAMARLGLADGDVICDLGAGYCDLDVRLRSRGWWGRYVPVDGWIDPRIDLETWEPFDADFFVAIDVVEHLHDWRAMVHRAQSHARKGMIVMTPDAETVDVLAMHPTHFSALTGADLEAEGFHVSHPQLPDYLQLGAFWVPPA